MTSRSRSSPGPWRAEARTTLVLAFPLILTNVAQSLTHVTDVVLLGRLGARTLAAAALGVNLYVFCAIFGMGMLTAAAPMVARERGRKSNSVRDVRRTIRQALWSAVLMVLPMWALLWNARFLLILFGQDPGLAAEAQGFVRCIMWALLPHFLYVVMRNFLAAMERPLWSFLVASGAVFLNAAVNICLIFGVPVIGLPALGLRGAGIGTSIVMSCEFLAIALIVSRHKRFRRYRLFGRFWRPDWPRLREIWRLGAPIGMILLLEVGVFNAAVFLMGLIGTASLAAHQIAIQFASLTFMVPLGLSQAATVRIGHAMGRRDSDGVTRAGWTSFALGTGFMAVMALVMWAFPGPLIALFIDTSDPLNAPVIPLATAFLGIAALFQIVDGAQSVGAGMLRGLHDTRVPMAFALFGYWAVGMGLAVGLGFGLGWEGVGIWTGLAAGLAVVSVLMLGRWVRRERLGLVAY